MQTSRTASDRLDISAIFDRDGFVIVDLEIPDFNAVSNSIIAELAPRYGTTSRIENAWRCSKSVRDLAVLPFALDTLRELFGRAAFPFQTLNFNRGTEQATHSDTIHFASKPSGFMAGVWIALEDIDHGNGPLRLYPGSHRLPELTLSDFGVQSLVGRDPHHLYRTVYEPGIAAIVQQRGLEAVEPTIGRGQALIWAPNLLHGGAPIRDASRTRHSQVTHYYFDGCSYHTPLSSDAHQTQRRYPVDIRTGRNVGGEEAGKPLAVPITQRAKSWAKSALRLGTVRSHSM